MMQEGGLQVQKGMNFGVKKSYSIVLVSTAKNPPYNDELFDNGVIEYEGHDAPRSDSYDKKEVDQPSQTTRGKLTENGKFLKAAMEFKEVNLLCGCCLRGDLLFMVKYFTPHITHHNPRHSQKHP